MMKIFQTLSNGGQTWAHRIRMLHQVLKIAAVVSFILSAILFIFLMLQLQLVLYEGAWYYLKANTIGLVFPKISVGTDFWEFVTNARYTSDSVQLSPDNVSTYTEPYATALLNRTTDNIQTTSSVSFFSFFGMLLFFLIRGFFSKGKKHISGRKMSSPWFVALRLNITKKASSIKIGSLPLLKGTETQHIMVTGGTGSGKSNCFHHILPKIRKDGHKAIIVDTTGIFTERYFREGKDILLNPFDKRSASWHPWAECKSQFDIEDLAESFIPTSYSDQENYWRSASKALFSSLMQKAEISQNTSDLTRWILYEPLSKLCAYVQGTKGAAHIDINSEKTAASIRSVTSSFLSCLEFLNDTATPFSIRDWIQNETDDSWLFLTCTPAQRASIKPLISSWFSIATRGLIQLKPDFNRRIWFVVDELPSLHKLKDLETFLAESRKYGGCALLALQSISQLEAIYGKEITKTIVGNCATKIAFSEQDPEIAERISRAFGSREIQENQEGISYGAKNERDGVNLSTQTRTLPLISITEIQSLKRNQAFIKLPENYPITKIKLAIAKC